MHDCLEFILQAGKPVDGVTTIIDMEGVGSEWLWRPGSFNFYFQLTKKTGVKIIKNLGGRQIYVGEVSSLIGVLHY